MRQGSKLWIKLIAVALVVLMIVPVLAACDDDDDDDKTSTSPTVATSEPATSEPIISKEPVKIGAICSWSGPAAGAGGLADQVIAVVEAQVEAQGGIMGHPLEIITHDDEGVTSQATAGVTKLVKKNEVDALVWGGGFAPTLVASVEKAEELEAPLFTFSSSPADISDMKWVTRAGYVTADTIQQVVGEFIIDELDPITVGFLAANDSANRDRVAAMKGLLEDADIEIVYEQYPPADATDMSPQLTAIREAAPDVLVGIFNAQASYSTIFTQIEEQGGWRDITFVSGSAASTSSIGLSGAEGTYHFALWVPGLGTTPGSQEFEDAFFDKHGTMPISNHVFFYISLWTAIKAMELAGTTDDYEAIAEAARSGDLSWDSPAGIIEFDEDGEMLGAGQMFEVIDGSLSKVE